MAALAHAGVALASKKVAPTIPLWFLIISAYGIDLIWGIFFAFGIEGLPGLDTPPSYWSHGLFMALVWSTLAGGITAFISKNRRTALTVGLLFFSHWVVDFISHPMTANFPDAKGLPLVFEGSPLVGLGVWSTNLGVNIGEYGTLALGLAIYFYARKKRKSENS